MSAALKAWAIVGPTGTGDISNAVLHTMRRYEEAAWEAFIRVQYDSEDTGKYARRKAYQIAQGYRAVEVEITERSGAGVEWANLALAMLTELRQDYAPGALLDSDGVKAIQKLRAALASAASRERERAAKIVDEWGDAREAKYGGDALHNCASAIRAGKV